MRCPKRKPEPAVQGESPEQNMVIAIGRWRDMVCCQHCGMFGTISHGRTRSGMQRIIWFRAHGATEKYYAEREAFAHSIGL